MTMRKLAYILVILLVLGIGFPVFAADSVECTWKLEMLEADGTSSTNAVLTFGVATTEKRGTIASPGMPTPDKTLKFFAWNISDPLNTQWWPEVKPDEPYFYNDYTQKVASKDVAHFARDWHLAVYTVEGETPAPVAHTYRLSVASGTFPPGSQVKIRRDDDDVLVASMSADATEPIEFTLDGATVISDVTKEYTNGRQIRTTTLSFTPVYYTVSVECSMIETSYTYHLKSGWNLIGIPFAQVLNADAFFDAGSVFTTFDPWTQITESEDLEGGRAYWVFNKYVEERDAELTGRAYTNTPTSFPESDEGWRDAAVIAQWVSGQGFVAPTEEQVITRWDGRHFECVKAVPQLGVGYFIR